MIFFVLFFLFELYFLIIIIIIYLDSRYTLVFLTMKRYTAYNLEIK